eukprot:1153467-Pelagomonas_calceolata.AAC.4
MQDGPTLMMTVLPAYTVMVSLVATIANFFAYVSHGCCLWHILSGRGQESTMLMMLSNMVHHGMIYVPPGYITPATNFDLTEVHGGSAWGPGCLAAGDGSRQVRGLGGSDTARYVLPGWISQTGVCCLYSSINLVVYDVKFNLGATM